MSIHLGPGDALIVVDVQNDFLPGGALAVAKGEEVVPVLNRYLALFLTMGLPVFASRDWHPPDHCSFRQQGGPWPPHCIARSAGAAPPPDLGLPPGVCIVDKATTADQDAYSGFAGTQLNELLHAQGIQRLFVGGLATEYCVLNTVKDALRFGYATYLLTDAVRPVDMQAGDGRRAEEEMVRLGALAIDIEDLVAA